MIQSATISGTQVDTPTGMNTEEVVMQTSRDLQTRPTSMLNLILVLLTLTLAALQA